MNNQIGEVEYEFIRKGFIEGFLNAYNLASVELAKLDSHEANAAFESILGKASIKALAQQQAEKHVALLRESSL